MSNNKITITINGVTHQFQTGDIQAMRNLPWSERKQLIELLESIKQAEFVNAAQSSETTSAIESATSQQQVTLNNSVETEPKKLKSTAKSPNKNQYVKQNISHSPKAPQLDPSIKASDKDADDMMQRLILEQQKDQQRIPDKSAVIKVMLIVFAVIIGLILIF